MKFVKSTLALALLGSLSLPAMADITVYGKANLSVQSSDEGEGSFTEVKSNASRFGVKGSEKVSDGFELVYKMEWQVDVADEDKENHFKARNQYVGFKGDFGQLVIGRNDTAMKQSQGKIDLFNDLEADIKNLFKGENRLGDSITYTSNSINGFKFIGSLIAEDSVDGDNGVSLAVTYGDKKLKKSKLYASVANDSDVKGMDITRATVQGKVAGVKLGAMYQTQEKTDGSADADGFMVNAAYTLDKTTFKAQYQTVDFDAGAENDVMSLGVDYKLNKNAKVYGFYTTFDIEGAGDKDYLGVGISYSF